VAARQNSKLSDRKPLFFQVRRYRPGPFIQAVLFETGVGTLWKGWGKGLFAAIKELVIVLAAFKVHPRNPAAVRFPLSRLGFISRSDLFLFFAGARGPMGRMPFFFP